MTNAANTPEFFDDIWPVLSPDEFDEAVELLVDRWIRYELPFSIIEGNSVLDMGCGSARYSYALSKLGAESVFGLDAEEPVIPAGVDMAESFEFRQGDVLDLPFDDDSFDFVFCNGVLHHTEDWRRGIEEAFRVLKPGGRFWLMVLREHESWDHADEVRGKVDEAAAEAFKRALFLRDIRPGLIFFLTDLFFVPHRVYLTEDTVESELRERGFENVNVLTETDGPNLRVIAQQPPC